MHFTINGQSYDAEPDIRTSVLDLLREHLGLTGTQEGLRPWPVRRVHGAGQRAPDQFAA